MPIKFVDADYADPLMEFEEEYPEELKLDRTEKTEILHGSTAVILKLDGKPIGEIYGAPIRYYLDREYITHDEIPVGNPRFDYYCYSTTILKPYQNKGYGKILKAFWLGLLNAMEISPDVVYGHASTPEAIKLNQFFGAEMLGLKFDNWKCSKRSAMLYRQEIHES